MSMTTKKAIRDKYIQKAKRCSLTLMDMQFMFPDMCDRLPAEVIRSSVPQVLASAFAWWYTMVIALIRVANAGNCL